MTLNNISGNIIKILNDDYIIILFYFLDNMKKLTEEHIMRKIRIKIHTSRDEICSASLPQPRVYFVHVL